MSASGPFSEIEDGVPLWRIQVDDPESAQQAPFKLSLRVLPLPLGSVAAAALELSDVPGRPAYHHVCGPWEHPKVQAWFGALRSQRRLNLKFERAGWVSDGSRLVEIDTATVLAIGSFVGARGKDPDGAVRDYAAFYKEQFPKLKSADAVWDACIGRAWQPVAKPGRAWVKWAIAAALLAAVAGAYFVMMK